jgi:hypothetical protein
MPESQTPKTVVYKVKNFKVTFYRWLAWIGCKYCWRCRTVKSACDFSPLGPLCRKCNAERHAETCRNSQTIRENQERST